MYANGNHLIDWVSITQFWDTSPAGVEYDNHRSICAWAAPFCTDWEYSDTRLRGYNMAMRSSEGVVCAWNRGTEASSIDRKTGIHTQIGGKALNTLAVFGISDMDILRWAWIERRARITRIDIAVDASVAVDFNAMIDHIKGNTADTRATAGSFFKSRTGTTVYVGHKQSEKTLRVYDKAGEQGVGGVWTRAELMLKGKSVPPVVDLLISDGKGVIPGIIRAFCNFPNTDGWDELLGSVEKVETTRPVTETNTDKWLLESVSKTLAKRMLETEGLFETFLDAVFLEVGKLQPDALDD